MPRTALRHGAGGLEEVALDAVAPGDRLLIRSGDVVPVDGTVADGIAVLDESALTGEALPVRHEAGEPVMSGPSNAGDAFEMTAARPAAESTFAGIVRLVEQAQQVAGADGADGRPLRGLVSRADAADRRRGLVG